MSSDTEVQQLIVYVGTQAKIDEARQAGTIGPDDFVVVTDAPDFALQSDVQAIQVLIPTGASAQNQLVAKDYVDGSTLPSSTKYGASLTLSIDSTDYKVTATLKDQDGNTLGTSQVIDLPLESVVVGGSYDSVNKKIVLTLQNGNTIDVPVGDLVAGLQTEITAQNKLSADLVDDTNTTNKFVTTQEKTTWDNKQDVITDLSTIRSGAALGATALQPSALSNYVTTNTKQTITAAKAVFGTDVAFGSDQTQKNLFAVISDNNSQNGVWTGRLTVGAKDRTFILGTYGNKCVLGAHSWTNAQQGTGAAWEDVYINADGDKAVYFGGSPINGRQALFKVTNVDYNTAGNVQVNRVTNLLQSNWKDVACWDDDVSKFNNDAGYITSSDVGDATLTIQQNGTTIDTFTANATSDKTINVTVPTDTNDLTNGAGYITSSALTGYATETWVGQQGFLTSTALSGYATEQWVQNQGYLTGITSSDVTNALGYTPYDSSNPNGYITNSALSNYVTLNTMQTLTSAKKMFADDAVFASNQTALLATISNKNSATSDNAWVGRYICGAKNLTFLMGTYRTMAGIGVHTWTNAQTGAGAGWGDFYLNPDGDKTVYIGGYGWTKNSGLLKVKNSGSNSVGTVQVNKGTISSASWKDVAYKGENVKDFSFTSISGYDASKTQTLKHINGTLTWVDD